MLATTTAYETEIRQWQQTTSDKLRAEDGWLTLIGLYWLHPGINTLGSATDADIVLPATHAPDVLGTIELANEQLILRITAPTEVFVDGKPTTRIALRHDQAQNGPSLVRIGSITFFIILRGAEYGVRIRDSNNPARLNFTGRNWFHVDQNYQVEGTFVRHETPRTLQIVTSTGHLTPTINPGRVDFVLQGQQLSLEAFEANEHEIWFVLKDHTSGKSTYGGGRFLYAPLNADGTVTLDFNKAYHPPCAYTPFATCPRPPKENSLPLEILAGERS